MVSRSVRQDLPSHDKQSVLIAYVSQRWKKNKDEGSKINHQNTATDLSLLSKHNAGEYKYTYTETKEAAPHGASQDTGHQGQKTQSQSGLQKELLLKKQKKKKIK